MSNFSYLLWWVGKNVRYCLRRRLIIYTYIFFLKDAFSVSPRQYWLPKSFIGFRSNIPSMLTGSTIFEVHTEIYDLVLNGAQPLLNMAVTWIDRNYWFQALDLDVDQRTVVKYKGFGSGVLWVLEVSLRKQDKSLERGDCEWLTCPLVHNFRSLLRLVRKMCIVRLRQRHSESFPLDMLFKMSLWGAYCFSGFCSYKPLSNFLSQ